jgi:predicted dehydrogenase
MEPAPTDGVRKPESKLKGTSRRKFLRQAGTTAGAAFAAPYVITSTALGNATTPPASDRIVMGGIGIGNMGAGDQNAFLGRPDVQYVAVCDVRQWFREGAKKRVDDHYRNGDCTAHVDFRDVLARPDIDAVHIATPDHWHAVMTIAACRAGKDVYLQKPETLTLREGPLMVAAARRHGRIVSGGSQRVLEDYRDLVLPSWTGELGDITSIDIYGINPSQPCYLPAQPTNPEIDWDLWLGPAPWQPYNKGRCDGNFGTAGNSWRSYEDYSGGGLTDWGAHHFGGAIFAADLRESQPAKATYHAASSDGKVPAHVSLTYPKGVELHLNRPQQLRPVPQAVVSTVEICGDGRSKPAKPMPEYRGTGGIYGDFIESVKTRQRPFRDIELAVNTMTAPHILGIALRLQRSLEWDAEKQQFVGDDEANRLVDRARREPWMI